MICGINKQSTRVVFSRLTFTLPDILKTSPLPTQTHHRDNVINREGGGKNMLPSLRGHLDIIHSDGADTVLS